jgi:hypothetical protein
VQFQQTSAEKLSKKFHWLSPRGKENNNNKENDVQSNERRRKKSEDALSLFQEGGAEPFSMFWNCGMGKITNQ